MHYKFTQTYCFTPTCEQNYIEEAVTFGHHATIQPAHSMSRTVSTLSNCSPYFTVPPSLHEKFTQVERQGVHMGKPLDPTSNQTKSAHTMTRCWLLQSEIQYHALIHVRCSHIFTIAVILKLVTLKRIWPNTQIMYPLFQFCSTLCHVTTFRSHTTIDTLFSDTLNRHANFHFQFVAQYLLFTAPTCFGHIILPSSGSYTLHRSLQHILQTCAFFWYLLDRASLI